LKLRITLVDYLNAAPLGWSFLCGPHRALFEVVPASPAGCADLLARGEVEIGLIPSIEYQRIPSLRVIPGMAIAASRAVRSVVMARHRGRRIRSVALDTSSRTSVVLLQLLLRERMGLDPDLIPHSPDPAGMLEMCDAALLIGDTALQLAQPGLDVLDLAEAWIEWQNRPFVFALWVCRGEDARRAGGLVRTFQEAMEWGLAARPEIAQIYARKLDLPASFLQEYLYSNIDYCLDADHLEGLERFYLQAYEAGLIPRNRRIRFLGGTAGQKAIAP
jgi:chorismate dehydratase